MKALTIKDLSRTAELDRAAMSRVLGGTCGYKMPKLPSCDWGKPSAPTNFTFDATQAIGQQQCTEVNNGNNVAFANCISADVKPTQTANNNISFG